MVDFIAWDIYFVLMTVHMMGNCFRKGDDFDHFDFRGGCHSLNSRTRFK